MASNLILLSSCVQAKGLGGGGGGISRSVGLSMSWILIELSCYNGLNTANTMWTRELYRNTLIVDWVC